MAPKSTKSKKATEVKVPESDVTKKSRGKAKKIEEVEEDNAEIEMEAKTTTTEKKKRVRKAADEKGELIGKTEEIMPPPKKGRKKKVEEPSVQEEDTDSTDNKETLKDTNPNSDQHESNGTSEVLTNGKEKKEIKKVEKPKEKKTKKNIKQDVEENEEEEDTSAPKVVKSRGRKAQPKEVTEPDQSDMPEPTGEEAKPEPAAKGRKKAVSKPKNKQEEQPEQEETKEDTPEVEKVKEKPKNSRKNQTRKGINKAADNGAQPDKDSDHDEDDCPASKKQKVDEGQGEPMDEETVEAVPETKPVKGRRGRKPADPAQELEAAQDTAETNTKRRRKPEEKVQEDVKKKALKNKNTTDYDSINFSNSSINAQGKAWNFKICSWNVDGIRAWMGKRGLDYLKHEKPDILCLQEVKCSREKLPEEVANVPGYHAYWLCSDQDGYAGVGIYTSKLAMNVQYGLQDEELDSEGRIITAEYEQFYLICTYVPNAGRKLVTLPKRLQWNDAFRKYVKELDKKKPVIICGDMNVAHNEIDLANPKTNRKNAGFTEEERSGMTDLLGDGFVDTFRHLNPEKTSAYTFWTYMMNSRAKNVGWRLDYFIVSERLLPSLCDSTIRDQVYGSDHCPISLFLHLTSADKPKEEN